MARHEKEKAFQKHICDYLMNNHKYKKLNQAIDIANDECYIAKELLLEFISSTQETKLKALQKDYGKDSGDEIISALKDELNIKPLWKIMRDGLSVRKHEFKLFFPKPRSNTTDKSQKLYEQNSIKIKDELVIKGDKRIDIVLYLNGLPIITMELKHEDAGQYLEDAVLQYTKRNHKDKIYQLPFLHIALDTSEVKVATNPNSESNFLWFNQDLENKPITEGEYPVECMYEGVLRLDLILSYLSFYLVYVPKSEKNEAFSIFPRYHQIRSTNRLYDDILNNFKTTNSIAGKYLINHSAGSGKTLTMSWTADKLHSLYKDSENKAFDMIFLLTDRKSLDKNISDELGNFTHLKDVVKYAKNGENLKKLIQEKSSIIVSTAQKFNIITEELKENSNLSKLRIAFIIDEAHRSQDGKTSTNVKSPFSEYETEKYDDPNDEIVDKIETLENKNMTFIAYTATPSQRTVTLFEKPFDVYSEAQAIHEEYILDVASNIISYETLFNMDSKVALKNEKLYPKGVIKKALQQRAYEDEGLIQYKAEVMLRIFEEKIKDLINGKAKVMVVASSRVAGLTYFKILKEKIFQRKYNFPCKILYAFSNFTHPQTNDTISEYDINDLNAGELIEDRFEQDDYRILVVANKFQTGFNQPLLAGMFLDKSVNDINAVQTLSRLNRCAKGKNETVVVDFTNSVEKIFKAFNKYREGTPYEPQQPNYEKILELITQIKSYKLFSDDIIKEVLKYHDENSDALKMSLINKIRTNFNIVITDIEERVSFVYLLLKLNTQYQFLKSFFTFNKELENFIRFCEIIDTQLIKKGNESELLKALKNVGLTKANVIFHGEKKFENKKPKTRNGGGGNNTPPPKGTISSMLEDLKEEYKISDEEAIIIREICEEKLHDESILTTIHNNQDDEDYLRVYYSSELRASIVRSYEDRELDDKIIEPIYDDKGAILDTMTGTIISQELFNIGKLRY